MKRVAQAEEMGVGLKGANLVDVVDLVDLVSSPDLKSKSSPDLKAQCI